MDIVMDHAEKELNDFIASVALNPKKWDSWLCLHIEDAAFKDMRENEEQLMSAEVTLDSLLQDLEGTVYFCGSEDLYVISNDLARSDLVNLGHQLRSHLGGRSHKKMKIYDMGREGLEFIHSLCGQGQFFKVTSHNVIPQIPAQIIAAVAAQSAEGAMPRVLLIEDDPSTRWLVRTALKDNCLLATAGGVQDGIKRIQEYNPHVVFLDINLPDGSGFKVLDWITRENPETIAVMFSGNASADNMTKALEIGAYGFISKPFRKEELLEYLHT